MLQTKLGIPALTIYKPNGTVVPEQEMKRSALKSAVQIGLIAVACWNVVAFTSMVLKLPSRGVHHIVGWEKAWEPIHLWLKGVGYDVGDIGYVTARSLRGEPPSEIENVNRAELYYVVIPLNLVQNRSDTPYVLGDFTAGRPTELPPNLVEISEPGNGLVLLRNTLIR